MKKRILPILMTMLMICSMMPMGLSQVYAADNTLHSNGNCGEREYVSDDCGDNASYTFNEETGALVISGTGGIGNGAFGAMPSSDKDKIKTIKIIGGITSIGTEAFAGAQNCISLQLPAGLESIGAQAFYNCFALDSVTLPDSLKVIGEAAFYNDNKIKTVDIPAGVTDFYWDAFGRENGDLEGITIRSNNIRIIQRTEGTSYKTPSSMKTAGPIGGGYDYEFTWTTKIPGRAFSEIGVGGTNSLESVAIPSTITEIGECAFYKAKKIESVDLPDGLTSIGEYCFAETGISSIDIPDGVKEIPDYAFYNCSSLTALPVSDHVTKIGYAAFHGCTGLGNITIPASVESIGADAFRSCSSLNEVTILNGACTIADDENVFDKNGSNPKIKGYANSTAQSYADKHGYTFEALPDQVITYMDIGNVWTTLSPTNGIAYTTAFDPDGQLDSQMEFVDQFWTDTQADESGNYEEIHIGSDKLPVVGHTYAFSVIIAPKAGYAFDDSENFTTFIYGGSTVEPGTYGKRLLPNGCIFLAWGVAATANPDDLNDAGFETTVSGIQSKTYNGKAQTQAVAVKIKTHGEWKALKDGTDYSVSYKNNKNAGTASVLITGKGNFKGTVTKTFKIKKAANPLNVKGKTAQVKLSKLNNADQKLAAKKYIKTVKKGQGTMKYTLSSARKGSKDFKKSFKINSKTGKLTVSKGLKKGKYTLKVKVQAAGNANYKKSAVKTITITINIK